MSVLENKNNPGMTIKLGEYTVTVRAESDYKMGRNDTADFLNHLSILLGECEGDWADEAKKWDDIIYEELKAIGLYDKK